MRRFFAGMLLALCCGVAHGADERVLLLDNGRDRPVTVSVSALLAQHAVLTLAVDDPEYAAVHTYEGLDFKAVLTRAGFAPGAQLLLVCSDGYSIPFDSNLLEDPHWQGVLALRDLQAPEGQRWAPFVHGEEVVSFDPFYLVWAGGPATGPSELSASDLPWPYQLTGIRVLRAADYQGAMPATAAPALVHSGFDLYFKHCIKCHSVNGNGGTLGPALDREHGLLTVLQREHLGALIRQVSLFYPQSKMPDFDATLAPGDVDALIAYLQWMLAAE